jgi:hypothetical protein
MKEMLYLDKHLGKLVWNNAFDLADHSTGTVGSHLETIWVV